jgi:hypothetical protein
MNPRNQNKFQSTNRRLYQPFVNPQKKEQNIINDIKEI